MSTVNEFDKATVKTGNKAFGLDIKINQETPEVDQKQIEEFTKRLQEGFWAAIGAQFNPKDLTVDHDDVKKIFQDALSEYQLQDNDIKCKTLWEEMGRRGRFVWRLFRIWPLSIIAKRERERVQKYNAEVFRFNETATEYEALCQQEVPDRYQLDPKRILRIKMKTFGNINSVEVNGNVEV